MKNNKKIIPICLVAILVIIVGLTFIYQNFKPQTNTENKTITVEVIDQNKDSTKYTIKTNAEFLRKALEEEPSLEISGTESEYGLMIDTVNGIRADYQKDGAYWSILLNNELCNYGVDSQPVNDKDEFQIVYTLAQ